MSRSVSGAGRPRHLVGTIRTVLALTWEASPGLLLGTVALSMLAALVPPLLVWLGKDLVDTVVAGQASRATPGDVVPTVVALGVASAALRALAVIQSHRQTLFATVVELHTERRLLERAAQADMGYFDDPEWHDRAARATRNVSWRPASVAYGLTNVAGSVVTMTGMFALLVPLSPWLALLSLLSVLPPAFAQHVETRRNYEFWHRSTTSERQRNYLRDLLSAPPAAMEVRAFDLAPLLLRRHEAVTGDRVADMRRMYARSDRTVALTALASGAALAAAYGLVAYPGDRRGAHSR